MVLSVFYFSSFAEQPQKAPPVTKFSGDINPTEKVKQAETSPASSNSTETPMEQNKKVKQAETNPASSNPAEAPTEQNEDNQTAHSLPLQTEILPPKTVGRELSNENLKNKGFLEVGLEYPTNFGVHLRYFLTDSFSTHFGLGFMPQFFLKSFEEFSPSLGYLNDEEAKLISDTFKNSLYLDLRLTWSPYLKEFGGGPYLELGVSGIFLGSGEVQGSTLSKALPHTEFDELETKYSAKTNSYNATFHIGYQIPFEKIKLNIEVGFIKILRAEILDLDVESLQAPEKLSKEQKKSFQHFLETKGWIFPTLSGWLSFAF